MRAVILLLIWWCAVVTAEAQTTAPTAVASSSPKNVVEAVADPEKANSQDFDIEYLCRSFAFTIDRLSVQLSQTLGPWSQRDLFLQITPAKVILGILSALSALAILQIFRRLLAAAHRWRHSEPSERFWVGGILRALRNNASCPARTAPVVLSRLPVPGEVALLQFHPDLAPTRSVLASATGASPSARHQTCLDCLCHRQLRHFHSDDQSR